MKEMKEPPEMPNLTWEKVKSSRTGSRAFKLNWDVHRAKVPGGWLVVVIHNTYGLTFYPDPEYKWDEMRSFLP
jgi:hypothetical protein